jgi:hypothetical protein
VVSTSTVASPNPDAIHVSLVLPSPGIASGRRVNATLVIQNDTGAPVLSDACDIPGESVLGQIGLASYPPPPPTATTTTTTAPAAANASTSFTLPPTIGGPCLGPTHEMVRVGTTSVPFMLEASNSLCQLAPAGRLQVDPCLPGGAPLPPGTYYVDYDWYGGNLPTPVIAVRVTAPTG